MVKKTGLGIAAAIIVIAVTVYAADSRHFSGLPKEIRTIFKGILSPHQISTLIDFRRDHAEKFHLKAHERPDLYKTWKELDLSQEQQREFLRIAGNLVDKTHPNLTTVIETGAELKRKVFDLNVLCLTDGNPQHPEIQQLSAKLGTEIGEISWNVALARAEVRSVLTPEQIKIMEQQYGKHDLRMQNVIEALPGMAEDLAALWDELKLTPNQADALAAAHGLVTKYRQTQHIKKHDEWRADLAKILTPEQLAAADRFHEQLVSKGRAHFLRMSEERERFLDELGLTGEQKLKLIQIALDRRARGVPAIQDLVNTAGALREQVHADTPDRSAVMAAAARLGDAVGQAACVATEFTAVAKELLTTEQMDLLKDHINKHLDQHLKHARIMPEKVHALIDFFSELGLTPEQKDQVVQLFAEKHGAQRTGHHGMKGIF
jgi:Spy/CpxP family protein refolding chaperone